MYSRGKRQPRHFKDFMKWLEYNFTFLYIAFLCCVGCLLLGHEINQIKHDAEIRHNQKIINNCNQIIAREAFQ